MEVCTALLNGSPTPIHPSLVLLERNPRETAHNQKEAAFRLVGTLSRSYLDTNEAYHDQK